MKCRGSTSALQRELACLSTHNVGGIRGVAVKCLDITKNSDCEGSSLDWSLTLRLESVGIKQD